MERPGNVATGWIYIYADPRVLCGYVCTTDYVPRPPNTYQGLNLLRLCIFNILNEWQHCSLTRMTCVDPYLGAGSLQWSTYLYT